MRPSCPFCATKHLSQAIILIQEAVQGYPEHYYLALGHLAEAADEMVQRYPALAEAIRAERKLLEGLTKEQRSMPNKLMRILGEVAEIAERAAEPSTGSPVKVAEMRAPSPPVVGAPYVRRHNIRFHIFTKEPFDPLLVPAPAMWTGLNGRLFYRSDTGDTAIGDLGPLTLPLEQSVTWKAWQIVDDYLDKLTAASTPGGCGGCAEAKRQRDLAAKALADAAAAGEAARQDPVNAVQEISQRVELTPPGDATSPYEAALSDLGHDHVVVILTTLNDFDPSYSLATCIKDQACALALAGKRVLLFLQTGASYDPAEFPSGVRIMPHCPRVVWRENTNDVDVVEVWHRFLMGMLRVIRSHVDHVDVISHDLLFQSWFTSAAWAIHRTSQEITTDDMLVPADDLRPLPFVRWHHLAHSSVGARPQQADDETSAIWARTNLPPSNEVIEHVLTVLSYRDQDRFAAYYAADPRQIEVANNVRDPRTFLSPSARLVQFLNMHPHVLNSAIVALYPFSMTRWQAKGVDVAIRMFAKMKAQVPGGAAVFILAAAHANGPGEQRSMKLLQQVTEAVGLTWGTDVICTAEAIPDSAGRGLLAAEMSVLWRLANLFIFPTTSEAGSLVLLEALASRCTLILNSSVPNLSDYVNEEDAYWIPWPGILPLPADSRVSTAELEDSVARCAIGQRGRAWEGGTWEDLADQWRPMLLGAELDR